MIDDPIDWLRQAVDYLVEDTPTTPARTSRRSRLRYKIAW